MTRTPPLVLLLLAAPFAAGQDRKPAALDPAPRDPKAVVRDAVAAHGGAALLDKLLAGRTKVRGTATVDGVDAPFTSTVSYQLPNRIRIAGETTALDQRRTLVQVLDGDAYSVQIDGKAATLPPLERERVQMGLAFQNVTRLTPLLVEPYALTWLGEAYVGERPSRAVKVTRVGMKDIKLYFDRETSLLLKAERCAMDARGKSVPQEELYSNYGTVSGLRYPVRTVVFQNGVKVFETETVEFAVFETLPAAEFRLTP